MNSKTITNWRSYLCNEFKNHYKLKPIFV